jgi:GNAT superfamily N-acetyltransferase
VGEPRPTRARRRPVPYDAFTEDEVLTLGDRDPVAPADDVVALVERAGTATGAAYGRSDVVAALHEHQPAVVALTPGGDLVGAVVARVSGSDAHVVAFAIHPDWRRQGIGSALLRKLDQEVIHRGAGRLLAVVQAGQVGEDAFVHQGFTHLEGLHLYARDASMVPEELAIVERFGGSVPDDGLWASMKGFSAAKEILDRRVVAPLAHAELADQLGLRPPAAVLLFGPPGTGKTSFARAIASRLSWAFVELHPSLLGQGVDGARALRDALGELGTIDRLVCFIDEADEIASDRAERPDSQPLVNELLKAVPMFKSRPDRLVVMATNSIAAIDPALLRPGRFDLIIPVGAPDEAERAELCAEFLPAGDPAEVATRTPGFTPADFALVAQRAAQLAFDRALDGEAPEVTADDVLRAVQLTRPSVSAASVERFAVEAERFARL